MSDPIDLKATPGFESLANSYATASQQVQAFASELQAMTKASVDQTTQLMEKMRGAKTIEEVVALQTSFMQQSFSHYADYTRRVGELMMAVPIELAKQAQTTFQQGSEAIKTATDQAGEHIERATHGS